MRDFLPSFIISMLMIVSILVWDLWPPNSGAVLAVLGPSTTLRNTIAETDAFLVREGRLPNSYVLYSRASDFSARLRDAGAILILNSNYDGACLSTSQEQAAYRFSASLTASPKVLPR